jgi:hypothetical protein
VTKSLSNFISRSTKAQANPSLEFKETTARTTVVKTKQPINYRNAIKSSAIILIIALLILFAYYPGLFPSFSLPGFNSPQTSIITPTPNNAIVAKDLAIKAYGDFLQEGQTNTYYFDIINENSSNIKIIKVIAQGQSGNIITSAAGVNYIPSIGNKKFDYISSSSANTPYAVIEIDNPKPGRYFVILKGIRGSGDTRVARSLY